MSRSTAGFVLCVLAATTARANSSLPGPTVPDAAETPAPVFHESV